MAVNLHQNQRIASLIKGASAFRSAEQGIFNGLDFVDGADVVAFFVAADLHHQDAVVPLRSGNAQVLYDKPCTLAFMVYPRLELRHCSSGRARLRKWDTRPDKRLKPRAKMSRRVK